MEKYSAILPIIYLSLVGIIILLFFLFAFDRKQRDRKTWFHFILFFGFGGICGWLIHLLSSGILSIENSYIIFSVVCFLIGIFLVWYMLKKVMWVKSDSLNVEKDSFVLELLFIILCGICLSLGVAITLKYRDEPYYNYFLSSTLLLPAWFLIIKSLDCLFQIPANEYKIKWKFPKYLINEQDWPETNNVWIGFESMESYNRPGMTNRIKYRAEVPRTIALGEIFRLAIKIYNGQGHFNSMQDIGVEPENENRFWWLFKLKFVLNKPHTWFPNFRILDPTTDAITNGLRTGDLVQAIRMSSGLNSNFDESIPMGTKAN